MSVTIRVSDPVIQGVFYKMSENGNQSFWMKVAGILIHPNKILAASGQFHARAVKR